VSAIVLGPGDGQTIESPGGQLAFKARCERTDGAVTVFESVAAPGHGPPLHLHGSEDECIYVLEGELQVRVEGALHAAPAGSFVFVPRGVAHAWRNTGDRQVRLLAVFTPGAPGMERFFERSAQFPADTRVADAFKGFADEAGMEVVGPPLAQSDPAS
jgi:quercetin dioxygenase-like cupin family protein